RYWVLLPVMFVAGFGGFTLVTRAQGELSRLAGRFRGHALSRQHVVGAFGGTLYPLVFSGLLAAGLGWRSGFVLLATTYLLYRLALEHGKIGSADTAAATTPPRAKTGSVPWAVAVAALGVGIQTTIPLWLPTLLRDSFGASEAGASAGAGVYFLAVLGGRIAAAGLLTRVGEDRELRLSVLLVLAGYSLLALSGSAVTATSACAVIGFGVGPLLPLGVSRAARAATSDRTASSLVMAMGCVAQILLPAVVVALLLVVELHAALCATVVAGVITLEAVRRSRARTRVAG
ncbi:MAG: MFS transporter, partial [Solirubrobacterales bacterium]|nr:MFS transporter [Solirubrobacterales bacterium]